MSLYASLSLLISLPTDIAPATAAAIAALAAAPDRETVRAIEADWRAAHGDTWAASEAHARREDAHTALLAGHLHLLEIDGSWRVDYLPRELEAAIRAALARTSQDSLPVEVYRRERPEV